MLQVGGFTLQLNLVSLLVAWCLSEVIRYSFFALKVGDGCDYTMYRMSCLRQADLLPLPLCLLAMAHSAHLVSYIIQYGSMQASGLHK